MSWFGGFFGKKKDDAPSTQDALAKIQDTEDLLMKRREVLEKKIEMEVAEAKKHGTANKRAALAALRRKKQHEAQLEAAEGTLLSLENQRATLEGAAMNAEILRTLADTSRAMKKINADLDADKAHDLIDEIDEQRQIQEDIQKAISGPGLNEDMDELEQELADLQAEDLEKELLNAGPIPVDNIASQLPEVPSTQLPAVAKKTAAKTKEEEELEQLQAWAS
ncbi:charged multivesicular body protein 4c [Aphelenchoides avenae]|nr:charged multivesicular body protein 4c [Aphelenchus avenae]